jgi:type VI secretion system protein ImpK
MDRVTQATKDCFGAITQLRQMEGESLPPAELIHQRMRGFVDELFRRASDLGFTPSDAQDMAYALVALMDETALSKGEELRGFWMGNLLQYHFFQENLAGDGFFTRLTAIRNDPRRHELLQVYALCLLFGFQGRYRIRGGELELMSLIEQVQQEVRRANRTDLDVLSPHGARPGDRLATARSGLSLSLVSVAALGFALVVYGGFRIALGVSASSTVAEIAAQKVK